jgi:hypothetical protein
MRSGTTTQPAKTAAHLCALLPCLPASPFPIFAASITSTTLTQMSASYALRPDFSRHLQSTCASSRISIHKSRTMPPLMCSTGINCLSNILKTKHMTFSALR